MRRNKGFDLPTEQAGTSREGQAWQAGGADQTEATRGNISVQMSKLEEAGHFSVQKQFQEKKPLTTLSITPKGLDAMDRYTTALKVYLDL